MRARVSSSERKRTWMPSSSYVSSSTCPASCISDTRAWLARTARGAGPRGSCRSKSSMMRWRTAATSAASCADTSHGVGEAGGERPAARPRSSAIDLVEDQRVGHDVGADFLQHGVRHVELRRPARIGRVDDVEQERRLERLVERGAERRHEIVRELLDEAHGVARRGCAASSRGGARAPWCRAWRRACPRRARRCP